MEQAEVPPPVLSNSSWFRTTANGGWTSALALMHHPARAYPGVLYKNSCFFHSSTHLCCLPAPPPPFLHVGFLGVVGVRPPSFTTPRQLSHVIQGDWSSRSGFQDQRNGGCVLLRVHPRGAGKLQPAKEQSLWFRKFRQANFKTGFQPEASGSQS